MMTTTRWRVRCARRVMTAALSIAAAAPVFAQGVSLATLQREALDGDPRAREIELLRAQSELRRGNIEAERLPSVTAQAQAQYQSDVARPPALLPGGAPLFRPPKDTYDANLRIDQPVVDRTVAARLAVEQAQLLESQARVRTGLFALRQEVNDAFFAALLLQERAGALAAAIGDLEARLEEANVRVREGAALAADAAAIEATLLQRRQDEAELTANRAAALRRLSKLTGRSLAAADRLERPDLAAAVAEARHTSEIHARPEYEQFTRTRGRLARQQTVAAAQEQPRLSAFARLGYGRPGLNFISDEFEPYGVAGVQLQWRAWTWGAGRREREALALQQEIAAADEAAFARALDRAVDADAVSIDRLTEALALDDRIIPLREEIVRANGVRFREGVLTAAEYVDRTSDLLAARYARAGHQVELAQASARLLTTLGLEVR